jgi:peptide/nickel transport system permease protein
MTVLAVIVVLLVLLTVWIVRVAGWRFAVKRLAGAALIVLIVTFGTTVLLRSVGVDEEQKRALEELGLPAASQPCVSALGTGADVESVRECVDERGLDDSVFVQYASWAGDVLTGDLGYAFYKNREPLSELIEQRAPRTLWLFLYSQLIALAIAIPLGVWSAYQAGKRPRQVPRWVLPAVVLALVGLAVVAGWSLGLVLVVAVGIPLLIYIAFRGGPPADHTVNTGAFILLAIPVFILAETLRYAFAVENDLYQLKGYRPWSDGVTAHLGSVWLPALVLGLAATPLYLRLLRADMVENLQQDYVSVAKAKGLSDSHILFRHVLRPSTLTLLTVAGLSIALIINGAIVVEFIFDMDGLGSYLLDAVARREFFAVQTLVALVAVVFVIANTIVDVLYTTVDPRVSMDDDR